MKKFTNIVIATIIVLCFTFGLWKTILHSRNRDTEKTVQQVTTTLRIGEYSLQTYDISVFIGKTALEASQANVKVVTNGTGVNAFVTSINGRSAETAKHEFWKLFINGSDAQVGAGSYVVQKGDSILWQIDTY